MERVKGIKLSDSESLSEVGFDTKKITRVGAEMYMQMIFIDGFFHADPHPGNLMAIDEDTIGLVDFGMVGIVTREMKKHASDLFLALVDRDASAIAEIFDEMGALPDGTNLRAFIKEINDMMLRYYDIRLKQFKMSELLNEFIKIVVKFRFALPSDLTLLLKTLIELEGVGEKLDPDFNIIEIGKEYATRLTTQAFNPLTWGPEFVKDVKELSWTLRRIPDQISSVLDKAEKDKLRVNINMSGFDELIYTIRRTIDQLALSILIASFVVGSAFIVVSARLLPRYVILMAIPVLIPAALLAIWLVISILRRRG
jgi:ubiquinone biosynthesis protein